MGVLADYRTIIGYCWISLDIIGYYWIFLISFFLPALTTASSVLQFLCSICLCLCVYLRSYNYPHFWQQVYELTFNLYIERREGQVSDNRADIYTIATRLYAIGSLVGWCHRRSITRRLRFGGGAAPPSGVTFTNT